MMNTMLPKTACSPSRLGMPTHRSAFGTGVAGVAGTVTGVDVRICAANFARAPWDTSAWSPPTS